MLCLLERVKVNVKNMAFMLFHDLKGINIKGINMKGLSQPT